MKSCAPVRNSTAQNCSLHRSACLFTEKPSMKRSTQQILVSSPSCQKQELRRDKSPESRWPQAAILYRGSHPDHSRKKKKRVMPDHIVQHFFLQPHPSPILVPSGTTEENKRRGSMRKYSCLRKKKKISLVCSGGVQMCENGQKMAPQNKKVM